MATQYTETDNLGGQNDAGNTSNQEQSEVTSEIKANSLINVKTAVKAGF